MLESSHNLCVLHNILFLLKLKIENKVNHLNVLLFSSILELEHEQAFRQTYLNHKHFSTSMESVKKKFLNNIPFVLESVPLSMRAA